MEQIDHEGIVKEIIGNKIKVSIVSKSACVSCSINNVCNPSDAKEKIFTVKSPYASDYAIGERVSLKVSTGQGLLAVLLSYIIPVVIILTLIIVGIENGFSEGLSALIALGATAAYFLILFLTRKKAENSFNFSIHKQ